MLIPELERKIGCSELVFEIMSLKKTTDFLNKNGENQTSRKKSYKRCVSDIFQGNNRNVIFVDNIDGLK